MQQPLWYQLLVFILATPVLKYSTGVFLFLAICGIVYWLSVLGSRWTYYRSLDFLEQRQATRECVKQSNELNSYLCTIRAGTLGVPLSYTGRRQLRSEDLHHVKVCPRDTCIRAVHHTYACFCEQFGFEISEASLQILEDTLHSMLLVVEGVKQLQATRTALVASVHEEVPGYILRNSDQFFKKLGFWDLPTGMAQPATYEFRCVGSHSRENLSTVLELDVSTLEGFIRWMSNQLSLKEDKVFLTSRLRQKILERDSFTCCQCGAVLAGDNELLLDVRRVTRGSQEFKTLCWRCCKKEDALLII